MAFASIYIIVDVQYTCIRAYYIACRENLSSSSLTPTELPVLRGKVFRLFNVLVLSHYYDFV